MGQGEPQTFQINCNRGGRSSNFLTSAVQSLYPRSAKISLPSQDDWGHGPACLALAKDPKLLEARGAGAKKRGVRMSGHQHQVYGCNRRRPWPGPGPATSFRRALSPQTPQFVGRPRSLASIQCPAQAMLARHREASI